MNVARVRKAVVTIAVALTALLMLVVTGASADNHGHDMAKRRQRSTTA